MLLLLDNYDSFTYNLLQYLKQLHQQVVVYRNDEISLKEIEDLNPSRIIISPGPGKPEQAGITLELIHAFAGKKAILGVCLGHQAIAQCFGATIVQAKRIMHGKTSQIFHNSQNLFADIPVPFRATRYHSLLIDPLTLPAEFSVDATTDDLEEIMGISSRKLQLFGVQFHPESILTEHGHQLLKNFLTI